MCIGKKARVKGHHGENASTRRCEGSGGKGTACSGKFSWSRCTFIFRCTQRTGPRQMCAQCALFERMLGRGVDLEIHEAVRIAWVQRTGPGSWARSGSQQGRTGWWHRGRPLDTRQRDCRGLVLAVGPWLTCVLFLSSRTSLFVKWRL